MKSSQFVAVSIDGNVGIHAPSGAGPDYSTLCGVDPDDPVIGHYHAKVPRGVKIDCDQCRAIYDAAKLLRVSDFKP